MKPAAIISVSAVLALCGPLGIPAHARGHRNINQWPWYGGVYATAPYDNYATQVQPANFVYVVEPPRVHSCQYNKETITVPSESGGTRDITVTRC